MRFLRRIGCLLLACLLLCPAWGLAEGMHDAVPNDQLSVQVTVGYDGVMTYGKTMPLTVRIENKGGDLDGRVCVNIYATRKQYDRYEAPLPLAAGAVKEVRLPVRVDVRQDTYTVEIWQGNEKICAVNATPERTVNPGAMLAGVLAEQPGSLSYLDIDATDDPLMRSEYIKTVALTADNFPDTAEMMGAFGMLVIDGFDVRTLSDAQQAVLKGWLENGHILILGGGAGAATGWPAFSQYTGLTAGAAEKRPDPTGALLSYLEAAGDPAGQEMLLAEAAADNAVIRDGDTPILWRSAAGNGVIYTAAFSLADKALTQWSPMHTFFQRLLIKDCYTLYQRGFSNETDGETYFGAARGLPLENTVPLTAAALTAAGLLLGGGGIAYLLLRRKDRRQFMWLALPLLAATAVAAVTLIAGQSGSGRPAVLGITVIRQEADGVQSRDTSLVLGTAGKGMHIVSVSEGTMDVQDNHSYWYYSDEDTPLLPAEIRFRFMQGEESRVGISFERAWEAQNIRVRDLPVLDGPVEAEVWMAADGLHGTIVNRTGVTLEEGLFCCKYGYCTVPALKNGESYDLFLKKSAFADEKNPVYDDGCMYESLAGTSFSPYTMIYEFYFQQSHQKNGTINWNTVDQDVATEADLMTQALNGMSMQYSSVYGYSRNPARQFFYAAYTEGVAIPSVSVDGTAVDRVSGRALFGAVVPFIQQTGSSLIYRVPGTDAAIRCQVDENGVPYDDGKGEATDEYYYPLKEKPVFMFHVSEAAGAEITRLAFYTDYLPNQAQAFLYNGTEWVEYTMGKDVENPGQYVDAEGRAYIQFRPVTDVESYYDVYTPVMLLEGREQ